MIRQRQSSDETISGQGTQHRNLTTELKLTESLVGSVIIVTETILTKQ